MHLEQVANLGTEEKQDPLDHQVLVDLMVVQEQRADQEVQVHQDQGVKAAQEDHQVHLD